MIILSKKHRVTVQHNRRSVQQEIEEAVKKRTVEEAESQRDPFCTELLGPRLQKELITHDS
jgi:hypothetical protein